MNNLDRYNEHILQGPAKVDSFIANVNFLARKFENLIQIDNKFNEESVRLLAQLVQNALDIQIKVLAEDLRKGTYYGYRKLDIDLLTNFRDYDYYMSDEDKNKLWNDPTKQVYYDKVRVYFSESSNDYVEKEFAHKVSNHHQLLDELNSWTELKEKYDYTAINISPDTVLLNHELLRITDDYDVNSDVGSNPGSKINRVALFVAQDLDLNAGLAGAKNNSPVFSWVDTTSSLLTIANKVNEIIYTADYIQVVGKDFVEKMQQTIEETTRLKNEADTAAGIARAYATQAENAVNKQLALTVTSKTLDADASPTVVYNSTSNTMAFGLPRSEVAIVGLSGFNIQTDNGHLVLNIRNTDDIKQAYVNESGNLVLELN